MQRYVFEVVNKTEFLNPEVFNFSSAVNQPVSVI